MEIKKAAVNAAFFVHAFGYRIQCLAKSAASFADQSPFGFSFKSSHHASLPTSVHAVNVIAKMKNAASFFIITSLLMDTVNARLRVFEQKGQRLIFK
jgi:hypothetical protein